MINRAEVYREVKPRKMPVLPDGEQAVFVDDWHARFVELQVAHLRTKNELRAARREIARLQEGNR